MTDRTASAGWVVQLTIPGTPGQSNQVAGPSRSKSASIQFFDVAIESAEQAVEAVRKKSGAPKESPARVVRALSKAEIAAVGLRPGALKPS
jgi:hypothetical protein